MLKVTESESLYNHLEKMETSEILTSINNEDYKIAETVRKALPQIEKLVNACVEKLKNGGRLFYIGAGTSGRLGILDASECPPTFGVSHGLVIGIIAGGDAAIRKAVEHAEDDKQQGFEDLKKHQISEKDFVIGISASGTAPYVLGCLETCNKNGILTGSITCNPKSVIAHTSQFPIEVITGPEFLSGSTRMKSGTAQKLVLNMISTASMIKLGRVLGNKMVDMQLSNDKLIERGTEMIMKMENISYDFAKVLLLKHGSVRKAVEANKKGN